MTSSFNIEVFPALEKKKLKLSLFWIPHIQRILYLAICNSLEVQNLYNWAGHCLCL